MRRSITGVPIRGMPGTHTFRTVKGWCTPARVYIEKAFKPLGIKATYGFNRVDPVSPTSSLEELMNREQSQTVTVNNSQASWAEYVLGAVESQTEITIVRSSLLDQGNFNKGRARSGVPMPWIYKAMGEVPKDSMKKCVSALPESEQRALAKNKEFAAEVEKRDVFGRGFKFTSEGVKRGGKGGRRASGASRGKARGKRARRPRRARRERRAR